MSDTEQMSYTRNETDHPEKSCEDCGHASDCATHNDPAAPSGPCDCGHIVPRKQRRYVGFVGINPNGDFKMLAASAAGDTSPEALEEVRGGGLDWIYKHPLEPWAELAIYELVEVTATGPEGPWLT